MALDGYGVESDVIGERKVVVALIEDIDQLAATARDGCSGIAPNVQLTLELAWWFAEEAFRDLGGYCSGNCGGHVPGCETCKQFAKLAPLAAQLRRLLK